MATAAPGWFICLEGPDGAGKSRAAARLTEHLRAAGKAVTQTREPGGTELGERIRRILLDRDLPERLPEADALLFSAARRQLVSDVIEPALRRGEIVVCDRFAASTLAYQGYGGGVDRQALERLEVFATGGRRPDLVLLLDVPVAVGAARRAGGDPGQVTRFEDAASHGSDFHERVRRGYLALAESDPARWRVVDGDRPPDQVDADLSRHVDAFLAAGEPSGAAARITG
jgi:dTMP kinase